MKKMNKKNLLFLIGSIIIFIIMLAFIISLFFKGLTEEERLKVQLEDLGSSFYTEFYYPRETEGKTEEEIRGRLSRFTEVGLMVDLDSLIKSAIGASEEYNTLLEEFKTNGQECDVEKTLIYIFTYEPFGRNDFRIETELACGFEENSED